MEIYLVNGMACCQRQVVDKSPARHAWQLQHVSAAALEHMGLQGCLLLQMLQQTINVACGRCCNMPHHESHMSWCSHNPASTACIQPKQQLTSQLGICC
jgi:hypothetical protein